MTDRFETREQAEANCGPDQFVVKTDFVFNPWKVFSFPKVGEKVSEAFNGDYYPAGVIVKVSASKRVVTTDTGRKFYRKGETAKWLSGGFAMVAGHHDKRNPHF